MLKGTRSAIIPQRAGREQGPRPTRDGRGRASRHRPAGLRHCSGLGRVQAKTRPLEGVISETAAKLVHSVWRGKDVRIIKESHCILVGAEVSLQVAECGEVIVQRPVAVL